MNGFLQCQHRDWIEVHSLIEVVEREYKKAHPDVEFFAAKKIEKGFQIEKMKSANIQNGLQLQTSFKMKKGVSLQQKPSNIDEKN